MTRLFAWLDKLYELLAWAAALSLAGMLVVILLQIAGAIVGFYLTGLDAYAVYFLAASIFLAFASTLSRGEHIRVTLVLQALPQSAARALDLAVHLLGTGLAVWMSWAITKLVFYSYKFNEISLEMDATPLWIPQSALMLGVWAFALAAADRTLRLCIGQPAPRGADDIRRLD